MRIFTGLLYLPGVLHSWWINVEGLWEQDGIIVEFLATMSVQQFQLLVRCLWFDNGDTRRERLAVEIDKGSILLFCKKV